MFVRSEDPKQRGYYISSLTHPDQKALLFSTGRKAIFVANERGDSSYVLYLQNRTLLARRAYPRSLALIGDPVPLASDVALFPVGFHGSFWSSASGNLLAYRTEASDKPRLTWIFPDGKRQSATGTDEFYTHLRVSPDGTRAAMELADGSGNMRPRTNKDWWPDQLDLSMLHQHSALSNPFGGSFNYTEEFKKLDLEALKRDLIQVMRTSQEWWPADYGHYGPLFIRMTVDRFCGEREPIANDFSIDDLRGLLSDR